MEKENKKREQLIFESLTPDANNELGIYETALDYVFKNPDIKNIALTGAFGAGKSSVLASYKEKTKDIKRKYIHISLAHFEDDSNPKDNEAIKESVLEGKILNQLIHQIPESSIPQTNFRIKSAASNKVIIKYTAILSLIVLLLLHLIMSSTWETYIETYREGVFKSILSLSVSPYAYLISGVILACLLVTMIYQAVKLQKNRRIFKKLNLQGNEIEMFEDSNDSYFDKYLNEVIYLFENANADVIVFEDIDRFDANQIFERIREVNTLVNLRLNDRTIRFFYLLKDDMFTSKDRTKFFDFIIPIVPVVDSSNSYDQLIAHLQRNNLLAIFSDRFLKGLSLYIDEMRLLKNICNEFLVYYYRLNTTEPDCNKMLALIAYKNLFPRDFCDLQLGQGFVHAIFAQKDSFIEDEVDRLEGEISEILERVKKIQNEVLVSVEELSVVYADKRRRLVGRYSENQRLDAEEQDRKQRIQNKNKGQEEVLLTQIDQKKRELAVLKSRALHEIINQENIDDIFRIHETNEIGEDNLFLDVRSSAYFPVLKYLIRNGYIDESYSDYMTYFYENSLSLTDKIFLRSITDRKAKEHNYALKDPKKVLEQLDAFDFDYEEVQNFSLVDYLMQTVPESEYVQHFISQLKERKQYDFIVSYLEVSKAPIEFVRQCNLRWKELFQSLVDEKDISPEKLNHYAVLTLYCSDEKAIESCNTENSLANYISATSSILNTTEPKTECLVQGFISLQVKFENLNYLNSNHELFDAVYKNSLYVITLNNLREILMFIYGIDDEDYMIHSNYSAIHSLQDSPIREYVESSIILYINQYLEFCNGYIKDENEAAVELLNNPEVSYEQKARYLKLLKKPLEDITQIENTDLWPVAIDCVAVEFSENNVFDYFHHSRQKDRYLIQLINSAERVIDFKKLPASHDKSLITQLFETVISCNELDDEKYEQCVVSLGCQSQHFAIVGLTKEKVLTLINHYVIQMNAESLVFIREQYPEAIAQYIYKNADEYIILVDEQLFVYSEMLQVLSMDIRDELKLQLLELTDEPISVIGKGYSIPVILHILRENIDESDVPILFEKYESYPQEIQRIILDYAKRNPDAIEDNAFSCPNNLITAFLTDTEIPLETKASILSTLIPRLENKKTIEYLNIMGLTDFVKVFDPHPRPRFAMNQVNETILNAFKNKGWIYEYTEDTSRNGFYRIQRKNPNSISKKRNHDHAITGNSFVSDSH